MTAHAVSLAARQLARLGALASLAAACAQPPVVAAATAAPESPCRPIACPALRAAPAPSPGCPSKRPFGQDAVPAGTDDVAGRRIASVCLVGAKDEATYRKIEAAVLSRAGERLDAKRVRDDVGRLAGLEELEDVAITAERRGEDVLVVVAVTEVPRIAAVVVERRGRSSCEPPSPLAVCGRVSAADLSRARVALRSEAASRGDGAVDVAYSTKPAGEGLVSLRVEVTAASGEGIVGR
ncbi:MAG: hypothetical protein R3B36_14055 [Polyangiaceae bacterium]